RNWTRSDVERTEELRGHVYGLESVFDDARGEPPAKDLDLVAWIDRTVYSEQDHTVRLHYLKVETDDDEVPIHWFMFDDTFLADPTAWNDLPDPRRAYVFDEGAANSDEGGDDDGDEDKPTDAYERFWR